LKDTGAVTKSENVRGRTPQENRGGPEQRVAEGCRTKIGCQVYRKVWKGGGEGEDNLKTHEEEVTRERKCQKLRNSFATGKRKKDNPREKRDRDGGERG